MRTSIYWPNNPEYKDNLYFVEVAPDELTKIIERIEPDHHFYIDRDAYLSTIEIPNKEGGFYVKKNRYYFLVSQRLLYTKPVEPTMPFAGMWGGDGPFRDLPQEYLFNELTELYSIMDAKKNGLYEHKIIFSRKGFDQEYGKHASPILPDGQLVSFPIPKKKDSFGIPYSSIYYTNDRSVDLLIRELGVDLKGVKECHHDPDLLKDARERRYLDEWKPVFGQSGAAEQHLRNENVKQGDLFLFFGSYKRTYLDHGALQFERDCERHILFGYLHIGEIVKIDMEHNKNHPIYRWAHDHPHIQNQYHPNSLYIASEGFDGIPGAGVFNYHSDLVLTKDGCSKSLWELPWFFHPMYGTKISRHKDPSRFKIINERLTFQTVGQGQDFVVDGPKEVWDWAVNLIRRNIS